MIERDIANKNLFLAISDRSCKGILVLDEEQAPEYKNVHWLYCKGKILVVHRLAVAPDCQNQGVASCLMDFAEDYGRRRSYAAIRLDAFVQNPTAVGLYSKRHYQMAGTIHLRKGLFYCFEKDLSQNS